MEHLQKIEMAAKDLIQYYVPDYSFVWDRSKQRKGECRRGVKQIGISKPIAELNTFECMLLTVIHEIAHALTTKGHHEGWRQLCISLGGDGQRTYSTSETKTPTTVITGECPNCHRILNRFKRSKIACGKCCRMFNESRFSAEYLIKWS